MKSFKVALVQHKIKDSNVSKNVDIAIRYISEAKNSGADFVLFPECFLTGYIFPEVCGKLLPLDKIETDNSFTAWCENALSDNSPYLDKIKNTAKELQIGVEITSLTKGNRCLKNTAYVIDRTGCIIMKYNKVHTCDFSVERYLESGNDFKVCNFDGICIGTMICYDKEYPESYRELMLQGAEIIMVPNDCGDMKPFRLRELSVGAMQNMTGIALSNPPGLTAGCSCAFTPMVWGYEENCITVADENFEGLVYASFDIEQMRRYRSEEDLGKLRKIKAYKHLLTSN